MNTWKQNLLTTPDIRVLATRSGSWNSCAVGEAVKQYPEVIGTYGIFNTPKDTKLGNLGIDFHIAVKTGNRVTALSLYEQIRERVKRLVYNSTRRYLRSIGAKPTR